MHFPTRPRAPQSFARLAAGWLLAGTLSLASFTARAQQPPPRPAAPASAGVTPAPPATPAPQAIPKPAEPVVEPPYDADQHRGLSEGAWLRATRGTARRSTGMMSTGIAFLGMAAILMSAGGVVYAGDKGCVSPSGMAMPCGPGRTTGLAVFSSGVIALGLGIPLTVYGASEVPRWEAGQVGGHPQAPGSASLRVTVTPGLGGGSVALHF